MKLNTLDTYKSKRLWYEKCVMLTEELNFYSHKRSLMYIPICKAFTKGGPHSHSYKYDQEAYSLDKKSHSLCNQESVLNQVHIQHTTAHGVKRD